MKIIRLTTFLDYGGIERKMENLSTWEDKNEWIFVCLNKGGAAENAIRSNGKKVICLELPYRIPQFKTIYSLYKIFKKEKPDVVHTAGSEANFHGMIAAKLAGVPCRIYEEIGIPVHSNKAHFVFQQIIKLADFITGESEAVIKNLISKFDIPKSKIKTIHNFVKPGSTPQNKSFLKNSYFTIVSVSRLEPVKNFEMALNVVRRLVSNNMPVKYLIVGDGTLRSKLETLVAEFHIKDHVEFLGFKPNPEKYLANADLFLLTSNHEGFSNSLLEAMYHKVPSLSTRVGGSEEMIVDGHNGWLVDVNNEEELYNKLVNILTLSETELAAIAYEGNKTVSDRFVLEKHMAETYRLYNQLAK